MENIFCPWEPASYLIFSANVPQILYYALIPGMLASIFLSGLIFLKNRKSLAALILLFISSCFFIWGFLALILFATNNPNEVMLYWSLTILVEPLIYASSLYLSYVFFDKKDISHFKKGLFFILLLPIIILFPTKLNLLGVRMQDCTAIEGPVALYLSYIIEVIFVFWIFLLAVNRFRKTKDKFNRKQIILFTLGILFFLLTFSSGNIIGSFTSDWVASQYGYFGMPVFIGFLAYLIVKYKAFNIKLLATQALVYALIVLIGSQFFFIQNNINKILTAITLLLATGFGIALIRSVKLEVERREELQVVTEKLALANKELKKLDYAKTEFISIASHQLRTPLTAIKGYVSLITEGSYGPVDPKVIEALKKVYTSNEHLVQLVEDLLNVSRIDSGRMTFNFAKGKVEDIIKELYDNFSLAAKNKGLYLNMEISDNLPEVEMDRNKIREVVSNLLDNALKYTKEGGVIIKAERIVDENKEKIRVTVSDTGVGIAPDEIKSIFSKFSRGKNGSKLSVTGTGLGLYVGKSMVETHGGKLWAESPGENKGSKFIMELPLTQEKITHSFAGQLASFGIL